MNVKRWRLASRRWPRVALLAALCLALLPAGLNGSGARAAGGPPLPAPHPKGTVAPRSVVVRDLPHGQSASHPATGAPFRPLNAAAYQREKQPAAQGATGRRQGVTTVPAPAQTAPATAALQQGTSLPLMSLSQQLGLFGADQGLQPPDTQLAAGPSSLVEFDNSTGSIWTKSGTLSSSFDLNTFFGVPANYSFSDPRIVFDTMSGRWIASGLSFDSSNDSQVYLGVSATSDPTGTWNFYTLSDVKLVLDDQPFVGVSADKIVVSWNDYNTAQTFTGTVTDVVQKSDALNGAAIEVTEFGPDANRFRLVPAQSLTSTTTEWMTYNNADCVNAVCNQGGPTLGVIAVKGTPAANNVAWAENDPSITATSMPPDPVQPAGGTNNSQNDDRLLSATWQNGQLWTTATDACEPAGSPPARDCLRLIQVSATANGASPTVIEDADFGTTGRDLYYPAATPDVVGNLFVSFSDSSSTVYPQAAAFDQRVSPPSTVDPPVVIEPGTTSYGASTPRRWGDYSAAALDPANPTTVWTTAEYVTSDAGWGTATAALSVVQPNGGQYNSVTPYGTQLQDFYYDNVAHVLRHSWWNGIGWGGEVLDGAGGGSGQVARDVGQYNSAIVYNGQLQDFYYDAAAHVLRHAWWNGAGWSFETLDGAGGANGQLAGHDVGQFNSAIIYNGQLQDFYYDATAHQLRHSWWNGVAWSAQPLDGAGGPFGQVSEDVGQHNSAILYNGQLQDFYYDATAHQLRHSWWNGVAWSAEPLDGAGGANGQTTDDVGQYSSTVLYNGQLQDFYYDATAHALRHAWWNGIAWSAQPLDGLGGGTGQVNEDVGRSSSTIVYNGQLQDFYYDAAAHVLRHAWWNGAGWFFETLDGAGGGNGRTGDDVGQYNNTVIYNGQLQDFYADSFGHLLRHAWWAGTAWFFEWLV